MKAHVFLLLLLATANFASAEEHFDCDTYLSPPTSETTQGTEKHYLSVLERGTRIERLVALIAVLEMESVTERPLIEKISRCEKNRLLKASYDMLLFQFDNERYEKSVRKLFERKVLVQFGRVYYAFKSAVFYIGDNRYLYCDWAGTAAVLLVTNGFLDKRLINELERIANSYFYSARTEANEVFGSFKNAPPYYVGTKNDPDFSAPRIELLR